MIYALLFLLWAALPGFLQKQAGAIVCTSSMWGLVGGSCEAAYSASKAAVIGFTKAMAKELGPSGIRVNALACGAIDTRMNACFTQEELESLCEEIPVGRLGTPSEIAEMVYMLYQSPAYLTGEIIKIDGGYL